MIKRLGLGLLLIALVVVAYLRIWNAGFIWDDDAHLTQNVCIVGPAGLKDIWTTAEATYYPLVLTTFWLLHKLAGLNPVAYHALDVALHAANAILVWQVLRSLNIRGAWMAAVLWSLHPVMVQSVAWITETKNTQSCFFYLLAIFVFVKWNTSRRPWQLVLAVVFAIAAMASKTSTVVLPAVLALIMWWQNRRLRWCDALTLVPFAALSAAASVWTVWEQKFHSGAVGAQWSQSLLERIAIAGRDIWFYLAKLAWPKPLIFVYPRWQIDVSRCQSFLPIAAAIVAFLTLLLFRKRTPVRATLFAVSYFVIALLPVLGFFDVYFFRYSFVSDHFQYLASIGPLALCGAGLKAMEERWPPVKMPVLVLLFGGLGFLTYEQTRIYHDAEILWRTTLARNPSAWIGHYELARIFRERGDTDAAVDQYKQGLAIWPTYADALYNLASTYLQKGDAESAIVEYRIALKLQPDDPEMHNNLANALRSSGRTAEAIGEYETALRLQPNFAVAHANLARAFLQSGEVDKAIDHDRAAVAAAPQDAQFHADLAGALLRNRATEEAVRELEKALRIDGDNMFALTTLSWLLATPDAPPADKQRAISLAQRAADITHGNDPLALHSLAAAYAAIGDFEKATANAQRAYDLAIAQPNEPLAGALSRELAAYRRGEMYQRPR